MIYIGIDGGVNGGLAEYNSDTNKLTVQVMPVIRVESKNGKRSEYNIPEVRDWFRSYQNIKMVILEKAQPFPGMPAHSTFMNGLNFGIMQGILTSLSIPYMIIHAKTWQKRMFEGMDHKDTKQASKIKAQQLFPDAKFIAGDKATKLHDGMTDATLMAYYGYLLHK